MADHGVDELLILPDTPAAVAVVGLLPNPMACIARHHPSGRPAVLSNEVWDQATVVTSGRNSAVLVGPGPLSNAEVTRVQDELRSSHASVFDPARSLPGVYHVITLLPGRMLVRGTSTGLRRLFHTTLEGITVSSSRADTLARLSSAAIDDSALVLRLLEPLPHPLRESSMWRGVHAVPAGHCLIIDAGRPGNTASVAPPTVPTGHLSLAVGAPKVLEALEASVAAHVRARDVVVSELSGGYDSTSVTTLASSIVIAQGGQVIALTDADRSDTNVDSRWAALAMQALPTVKHVKLELAALPSVGSEFTSTDYRLDEPSVAVSSRGTLRALAQVAKEHHAQAYLTGHGGDHLFYGSPTLARDGLRHKPARAIRDIAAYADLFSWSRRLVARQMFSREPYHQWLARSTTAAGRPIHEVPAFTWGIPATVPPWLTSAARGLLSDTVARAASRATSPLAPSHGRHSEIDSILEGAGLVRALAELSADFGTPLRAPFFDDRVMEAVALVDPFERSSPHAFKPLLAAAMRGRVPDRVLARTTKDEGSTEVDGGLIANAEQVRELLGSDSRLVSLGIVDRRHVQLATADPAAPGVADGALLTTIAVESWLRSVVG